MPIDKNKLPFTPKGFSKTIVKRVYQVGSGGKQQDIVLEVGRPVQDVITVDETDWRCPIKLTFGKRVIENQAIGVDSFQALQLAIDQLVEIELKAISRETGEDITFFGEKVAGIKNRWSQ